MSVYSIAVTVAPHPPSLIKLLRPYTTASVGELAGKLGSEQPVVEIDTTDFPLSVDDDAGLQQQQQTLLDLIDHLEGAGASVLVRQHLDELTETLSRQQLLNQFESERGYRAQEHD